MSQHVLADAATMIVVSQDVRDALHLNVIMDEGLESVAFKIAYDITNS